jgi:hypothetical protein
MWAQSWRLASFKKLPSADKRLDLFQGLILLETYSCLTAKELRSELPSFLDIGALLLLK